MFGGSVVDKFRHGAIMLSFQDVSAFDENLKVCDVEVTLFLVGPSVFLVDTVPLSVDTHIHSCMQT